MEKMKSICPMRLVVSEYSKFLAVEDVGKSTCYNCLEEHCAWYDASAHKCALLSLSESLYGILFGMSRERS